jgi:hypothetical protein
MSTALPISSAARNVVWVYQRPVTPRFAGAPTLVETTRSPERPDFGSLPSGSEVRVEFYGGAYSLWLDGDLRRVYIRRFEYVAFPTEEDARHACLKLWREVEYLESAKEVEREAERWMETWKRKRPPATPRNSSY